MPAEQPRPPLFVRSPTAGAVAARNEVLVFGARDETAGLGQDERRLFELGVKAVRVLERDRHAVHMMAVLAVNVDQPARHRALRYPFCPRRIANVFAEVIRRLIVPVLCSPTHFCSCSTRATHPRPLMPK
jgi:hypothetical protein